MGGGGTMTTTEYQSPRVGVARRQYGELGNGFKSKDEIEALEKYKADLAAYNKALEAYKLNPVGEKPTLDNPYGFSYNSKYGTYTLANGVDAEAALQDWQNYEAERIEIATYNAKEDRRKRAPDELQSSQTVDLSIVTTDDKEKYKEVPTITKSYDTSPSTASTQQPLGIY